MLVPMLTPSPGRRLPGPTALLAVAASMSEAAAAVRAGADLVDLGGTERPAIGEFRARHPGILVCALDEAADLVRHPAVAMATGALLICADPVAARASALPPARLIVEVMPDGIATAAEADWAALVDVDRAAAQARVEQPDLAGIVALAALSSWLGAAVVRTRHPLQVRRALDMAAAIKGTRLPARTVLGLA
jgi:NAD(P)H-hydrate repair Nnr-like enzyme with NAD(P)H-hydrate dehydratase domain